MAPKTPEAIERARVRSRDAQRRLRLADPEAFRATRREYARRARLERPEVFAERRRLEWLALRQEVIGGYGGACACCGTAYLPHLTIDHVDGGGTTERKALNNGASVYRRLRRALRAGAPESGYQVLCANCNLAKHTQGACGCGGGA